MVKVINFEYDENTKIATITFDNDVVWIRKNVPKFMVQAYFLPTTDKNQYVNDNFLFWDNVNGIGQRNK